MAFDNKKNTDKLDTINQRITAIDAYTQPGDPILLGGVTKTAAEVKAMYQGYLAKRNAVTDEQKAVKVAVSNRKKSEADRAVTDKAFKSWVVSKWGADSKEALAFGFPPPKTRVVKSTTKAHAALQAKATRAARHTMGKNEKADIKGTVPPIEELVSQAEGTPQHAPAPSPVVTNGGAKTGPTA